MHFCILKLKMDLKVKQRISLSTYFFISGVCFASWASRIPTIKTVYELNEAQLGNLLFIMPFSSLLGLQFSGWLILLGRKDRAIVI